MKCENCGTEVTGDAKFCETCGKPLPEETTNSENKKVGLNKKRIIGIAIVAIYIILCVILKYKILIPTVILVLLVVVIQVNRKILNKRKNRKESVEQVTLTDKETEKLSGYFVNRDEKYISSLGNGYIMNYLAKGNLSKGFAVVSDKRVYFRGSCFSGQGKTFRRTDEERTVDIKDVTGSGFIYQRYIGILIGVFMALVTLVTGVCGSVYGAIYSGNKISNNANYLENQANYIKQIEDEISTLETNMQELLSQEQQQEQLQEQIQEQQQEVVRNITPEEFFCSPEISQAFSEYMGQLEDEVKYGEMAQTLQNIADNEYLFDWNERSRTVYQNIYDFYQQTQVIDIRNADYMTIKSLYAAQDEYVKQQFDGFCMVNPFVIIPVDMGMDYYLAYWAMKYYEKGYNLFGLLDDYYYESDAELWGNLPEFWDIFDYDTSPVEEGPYFQSNAIYYDFMWKIAPAFMERLSAREDFDANYYNPTAMQEECSSIEVLIQEYIERNPDFSLVNEGIDGTDYPMQEEKDYPMEISALQERIDEMKGDLETTKMHYAEREKEYETEDSGNFVLMTTAYALAGLLFTFMISCFLVFLDYLKKRKTMFQIQYAGGAIAFDVSYYAKAEIEDFQKQLRRTKDLYEQGRTANSQDVRVAIQQETASSTQPVTAEELRKYADLLKDGLITQEEYDALKKKVLGL